MRNWIAKRALGLAMLLWVSTAWATTWSTQTHDIYPGDFNGDGKDDVLVIAKDAASYSGIFITDGSNTPAVQHQSWNSGFLGINWHSGNYTAVIGNFDGVNGEDVLLQSTASGTSFLLLTNSDGRLFGIHQYISGWGASTYRILAGKFDSNNRADVFLQARQSTGVNYVMLSTSAGHLTSQGQSWSNNHLGFKWSVQNAVVHVGDFNGDNRDDLLVQAKPEIVLVDYDIPIPVPVFKPLSFGVTLATTAGQFTSIHDFWSRKDLNVDWAPNSADIVVGDFNGDGRDDVMLVAREAGRTSYLALADGAGQFEAATVLALSPGANGTNWTAADYRMAVGDFNGDGRAELYRQATAPSGNNSIVSFSSTGAVSVVSTHNAPVINNGLGTAIGRIPGEFSAAANGAATYEMAIDVPTGTNGLKPNLSLNYSSLGGGGLLGVGWALSGFSEIGRCGNTVDQDAAVKSVDLTVSDRFCLDGNKLRTTSGAYGANGTTYQTEVDIFSRVTSYTYGAVGYVPSSGPQYFKAEGKDGLYYFYGSTEDARVQVAGTSVPRVWALNRVEDRNGNYLTISYAKGTNGSGAFNGSYRPTLIEWARTSGGAGPYFKVLFAYENRVGADVETGYFAGGAITEDKRIDYIEVQAFQSGSWSTVRKYDVAYEVALSSAGRSRIASITQCSASECLPQTTFQYQNGMVGWTSDETVSGSSSTALMQYAHAIDVDGDGIKDLVYPSDGALGAKYWHFMRGTSSGSFTTPRNTTVYAGDATAGQYAYALPINYYGDERLGLLVSSNATTRQVLIWDGSTLVAANTNLSPALDRRQWTADVDGDGLDDFVYATLSGNIGTLYVQKNTGSSSFAAAVSFYSNTVSGMINPFQDGQSGRLTDINADGRIDVVYSDGYGLCDPGSCESFATYYVLTAGPSGFTQAATWSSENMGGVWTGDVNGDGLTDVIHGTSFVGTPYQVMYGSGTGVSSGPQFSIPTEGSLRYLIDYDGDGRSDVLYQAANNSTTLTLLRFNGQGFDAPIATTIPNSLSVQVGDFDGDGQVDIGYQNSQFRVRKHNGVVPDLLTRVTDGFGNYAVPVYAPLTDPSVYSNALTAGPANSVNVKMPMYVVKNYTANSGVASPATYSMSYEYKGARVDKRGRGFLGFSERRVLDNRSGLLTVESYRQDFPYIGSLATINTSHPGSATNVAQIAYEYTKLNLDTTAGNTRVFPYISSATESKYEVGGPYNSQEITRSTTTSAYDSYGNLTSQTVVAQDVHGSSPLLNATYQTQVVNTMEPNAANWCVSNVAKAEIKSKPNGAANWTTRTRAFVVDTAKCRATQEKIEPDSATLRVTTDYTYYPAGHVSAGQIQTRTVTGAGMPARVSTYEYDPAGPFVTREISPLSQSLYSEWAVGLEVETARVDLNGKRLEWSYDTLGRKTQERRPDGTRSDYTYYPCTTGCGYATGKYQIVSANIAQGSTYGQRAVIYDMLGRDIQSTQWLLGGTQSHVLTEYDVMGRPYKGSAPLRTGDAVQWATTSYDLIGRPIEEQRRVSDTDGSTQTLTWAYEGLRTRQTDAEGKQIVKRTNATGQTVQMTDAAGTHTWYQYDAFGNATRTYIGDANGVESPGTAIVTNYDLRGRKVNSTDPDMGHWQYSFNALDELTSQTDAKNQPVSYEYDLLGRMKKRTETEGVTDWHWDTAANGIGALGSVSAPGYAETYTYDSLGRPGTKTITIDGTGYTVATTYNSSGQVDTVEYPQSYPAGYRFKIRYGYDAGFVKKVEDATGSGKVYWEAHGTDAAGEITEEMLGNNIGISSLYDSINGFLRQRYSGPGYSGATQALTYQWDRVGNLKQRSDNNQGFTENFVYDNLYRLDYSTLTTGGTTVTNLDVSYDALGNITSMTGAGSYTYHTTKKHAVVSAGSKAFTYDANGSMINRAGSAIDWYTYNLPKKLRKDANSSEFFYAADRSRYKQIAIEGDQTETTVYIGGWLEKVIKPSGVVEYKHNIPGGDGGAALYTRRTNGANDVRYLTKDHLGSIDTISDEAGTVLARLSFDAFGARRNVTSSAWTQISSVTHRGFTSHEMLDNIDLIHMNGRVYDPLIGRFISADPFVQAPLFSQSWNRYSYVANNPLSYVDPSGYSWLSKTWNKFTRALKKIWDAVATAVVVVAVAAIIVMACAGASEFDGGSSCSYAIAQALASYRPDAPSTGPPNHRGPYIGDAGAGISLPPGVMVFLGVPAGKIDAGTIDDIFGDPLFDTIIDVLKGVLIPGYDLYNVFKNPNATWVDWTEALASTAVSLVPPAKLAQLSVKLYRVFKASRATGAARAKRKAEIVDKVVDEAKRAEAVKARDDLGKAMMRKKAAYSGGTKDGKAVAGCSSNPVGCAEDDVARQLGDDVEFTKTMGWRRTDPDGPLVWEEIPVCKRCQGKYRQSQFPSDVKAEPGGPWGR